MSVTNIADTINYWIASLEEYKFSQLCAKPSNGGWSLGQVYMHLVSETNHYIEQIKICLAHPDNSAEAASEAGKNMLLQNNFPDTIIEGPPSNAAPPSQPVRKRCIFNYKK